MHYQSLLRVNFVADFGCPTEKLAEFHKELQGTKSIPFQFRV